MIDNAVKMMVLAKKDLGEPEDFERWQIFGRVQKLACAAPIRGGAQILKDGNLLDGSENPPTPRLFAAVLAPPFSGGAKNLKEGWVTNKPAFWAFLYVSLFVIHFADRTQHGGIYLESEERKNHSLR